MNQIKVKIIADTVWEDLPRITTIQLTYPRFIHSEFMTHRVFSRNASSSRAIPISKVIKQVLKEPAIPVAFGRNKKGMQAGEHLSGIKLTIVRWCWMLARFPAVAFAWAMSKAGVHKQIANRILEPWQLIDVVVTSTQWENFFRLRCHRDADPTIHDLAVRMQVEIGFSQPKKWPFHLPYTDDKSVLEGVEHFIVSTARCARVSYKNHDGTDACYVKDLELYQDLVGSDPIHASPSEHQAIAPNNKLEILGMKLPPAFLQGNFSGWCQHRKIIEAGYGDRLEDLLQ